MAYFPPLSWEDLVPGPYLNEDIATSAPWPLHAGPGIANDPAGCYADAVLGTASELEVEGELEFESIVTDFSSSELEDPDWEADDKDCHPTCDKSRLQKNLKERERVQLKKDSLKKLVTYLRKSELIPPSDKKKRFTEAYTVKMTTQLIQALERENERMGGNRTCHRTSRAKKPSTKKKTSNAFIKFSTVYRAKFVSILKKTVNTGCDCSHESTSKNPSQKIVQKLAAEVWNRLPMEMRSSADSWQREIGDTKIYELARGILS